jgi:hypothetical protein
MSDGSAARLVQTTGRASIVRGAGGALLILREPQDEATRRGGWSRNSNASVLILRLSKDEVLEGRGSTRM